jgi:hypothetical protein
MVAPVVEVQELSVLIGLMVVQTHLVRAELDLHIQ